MLRTYQPKKRHRSKVHGFRKRMSTKKWPQSIGEKKAQGQKEPVCLMKKIDAGHGVFCLLSKIIIQLFSNLLLKKQVKIDNGRGIFILFL